MAHARIYCRHSTLKSMTVNDLVEPLLNSELPQLFQCSAWKGKVQPSKSSPSQARKQMTNQILNRGKVSVPAIKSDTEIISSFSDKTKLHEMIFTTNFTIEVKDLPCLDFHGGLILIAIFMSQFRVFQDLWKELSLRGLQVQLKYKSLFLAILSSDICNLNTDCKKAVDLDKIQMMALLNIILG